MNQLATKQGISTRYLWLRHESERTTVSGWFMVHPAGFEPTASWFVPLLLVLSAGVEPATSWFEATRSIQMSYESKQK